MCGYPRDDHLYGARERFRPVAIYGKCFHSGKLGRAAIGQPRTEGISGASVAGRSDDYSHMGLGFRRLVPRPDSAGSFGRAASRWVQFAVIPVALFAASLWLDGCGGGSAGGDPSVPGTPAGTYSFVLSGTSTNTTAQVTLTLTVQ